MSRMSQDRQAWTDYVEARETKLNAPNRPTAINFTVPTKAAPQGSMSGVAITRADGSPGTIFKSDNKRTHPYRNEVGFYALRARAAAGVHDIFAPDEAAVRVAITFVFAKPKSAPASRIRPTVKPDLDKLARSTADALTGVLYVDDAQVVDYELHKIYGKPECVVISVQIVKENEDA
jgi:Holliday junction resolvase RusA-like endonuclease